MIVGLTDIVCFSDILSFVSAISTQIVKEIRQIKWIVGLTIVSRF